jgi:hypothetical protein
MIAPPPVVNHATKTSTSQPAFRRLVGFRRAMGKHKRLLVQIIFHSLCSD